MREQNSIRLSEISSSTYLHKHQQPLVFPNKLIHVGSHYSVILLDAAVVVAVAATFFFIIIVAAAAIYFFLIYWRHRCFDAC